MTTTHQPNRRTAAVIALAALALGGCADSPKSPAARPTAGMVGGDKLGRAIFAGNRDIAWAREAPAPAFVQHPSRD